MINKRLINTVRESKKYIALNVIFQWISLIANIVMMTCIALFASDLLENKNSINYSMILSIIAASVAVRFLCTVMSGKMSFLSSELIKKTLRDKIYSKLLKLGASYNEKVKTSEVVQVAVEGADQLETYFGMYLPQFFYAMTAPVTLFIYLCFINVPAAFALLICVPLIPVSIALVQTWAKKLLSKYWGQYTVLGDTFLENLQGLTTLKIYQADKFKNDEMNEEAEKFRKITMKVLTMQLNSITIMDLIAYGGAALGVIMASLQMKAGNLSFCGAFIIILLSADYFIPMRMLGSFFHIAMNGMAASEKIFKLLDLPEEETKNGIISDTEIVCRNLEFSYEKDRKILNDINMEFPKGSFTSIVGRSGCGKSTLASVLTGKNKNYSGSVKIGQAELKDINEENLMKNITYISHHSYLFKGTVRYNLLMGNKNASDSDMWDALERVNLSEFLKSEKGLDTLLTEQGMNFSGGQRQRLALARALLHNSPVYIFDEAASNIDAESEDDIVKEINKLSKKKTVILISHRLANVTDSDNIYVMEKGRITEQGTHKELLNKNGAYKELWETQQKLENYGKDKGAHNE